MTFTKNIPQPERLLRLPEVLSRYPVSRSTWYTGIKEGRFPAPVRLGHRTAVWRESDIARLIEETTAAA